MLILKNILQSSAKEAFRSDNINHYANHYVNHCANHYANHD